jgi:hypothetical protein
VRTKTKPLLLLLLRRRLVFCGGKRSLVQTGSGQAHGKTQKHTPCVRVRRMLAPSLFPTFGEHPAPQPASTLPHQPEGQALVAVESARLLRSDVVPEAHPVRARSWQERCGPETNSSGICVHIVVVNLVQDSPASFSLRLTLNAQTLGVGEGLQELLPSPLVASRLFESGGYDVKVNLKTNVNVSCVDDADGCGGSVDGGGVGLLEDWVGAGETVVYELGCNGPRPTADDAGSDGGGGGGGWSSCADRRVACLHGFLPGSPQSTGVPACPKRRPG